MSDAESRALLINSYGSFTAGYETLTGPVDSVEKFGKLLDWYVGSRGGLNPLGGPGQVWVIGPQACQMLNWWTEDPKQIRQMLVDAVAALRPTGWNLLGDLNNMGPQLLLAKHVTITQRDPETGEVKTDPQTGDKITRRERRMVQVILEPFAEEITKRSEIGLLEDLPEDDEAAAREVGRRVIWLTKQLGVLPAVAAATTGQRIQDEVYRARKRKTDAAVVDDAGVIPGLDTDYPGDAGAGAVGVGELEPAAHWGRPHVQASEMPDECELLLLDQTAAYLASAGSIELGFGEITHLLGDKAVSDALAADKMPFGVFLAVLPAGNRLPQLPKNLPLPHPLMADEHDITAWITTESVKGLCASVDQGGAALSVDDLALDEAYVWSESRRFLEDWASVLRAARFAAILDGDRALVRYIGAIYKQYVGRMGTDKWSPSKMHHWQPIWRAAIIAHCRWRARRQAMAISRAMREKAQQLADLGSWYQVTARTGLWPIYTYTDSWRYLVPAGMLLSPTEQEILELIQAGQKPPLGRLVEQDRAPLSGEQRALLLASTTGEEVSAVVYGHSGIPTLPMQYRSMTLTHEPGETAAGVDKIEERVADLQLPLGGRRGKGPRKRLYIGNRALELEAEVSPSAIRDLEHLVEIGKFSYLPDGVNHRVHTEERGVYPTSEEIEKAKDTAAAPVSTSASQELLPLWRQPVVVYTAAAVVAILVIVAIVLAVI